MNKNQPTEKISRTYCGCIPKGSDVDRDWQALSLTSSVVKEIKPVSEQTYLRIKPLYNHPLLLFPVSTELLCPYILVIFFVACARN